MSETRITGRNVFTGAGETVTIRAGHIVERTPQACPEDIFLAPALVDLQVNGYRGVEINAEGVTAQDVVALSDHMRAVGVTAYLPTLITAPEPQLIASLAAIAAARRQSPKVARAIPFIHVEGPWLSPHDGPRGAHPAAAIRPPDLEEFARWQQASGGLVGLVTLSPHWPESAATIAALTAQGCRVSIGHTHCGPEEIERAAAAGASLSTHLGNGIAATLPRHPNAIWAQLANDRLTKMFIADGHHLPADTLKAMLRAAGREASILVSDVVALGGMPPGPYVSPIGGAVELRADGQLSVAGTPYLAGAATPLIDTLPRAMRMADLSLGDVFHYAATAPARVIGQSRTLAVGEPADILRFRFDRTAYTLDLLQVLPE